MRGSGFLRVKGSGQGAGGARTPIVEEACALEEEETCVVEEEETCVVEEEETRVVEEKETCVVEEESRCQETSTRCEPSRSK